MKSTAKKIVLSLSALLFIGCVSPEDDDFTLNEHSQDIAVPDAVLLVHGVEPSTNTHLAGGHDCDEVWETMRKGLYGWGYRNKPIVTVGYYFANRNCDVDLHRSLKSKTYHHGPGDTEFTTDTDLRHLGYQLAWYIWNNYTSKGMTVGIAAHSMGGLISRYAIGQTGKHADFPTHHNVTSLVTINTPNNGAVTAWLGQWGKCGKHCKQMALSRDPFLNNLNNKIDFGNSGVPTRLKIGSSADLVVDWQSATSGGEGLKVVYHSPVYGHGAIHKDRSGVNNAKLQYRNDGDPDWTESVTGDRGVRLIHRYVTGL